MRATQATVFGHAARSAPVAAQRRLAKCTATAMSATASAPQTKPSGDVIVSR